MQAICDTGMVTGQERKGKDPLFFLHLHFIFSTEKICTKRTKKKRQKHANNYKISTEDDVSPVST